MHLKKHYWALLGCAILLALMPGCARICHRAEASPARPLEIAPTPAQSTPAQALPLKSEPVLRDSTGQATFPEIDKSEEAPPPANIPGIADTNLIDDPSKEWK
jgi:hypothetical protein